MIPYERVVCRSGERTRWCQDRRGIGLAAAKRVCIVASSTAAKERSLGDRRIQAVIAT